MLISDKINKAFNEQIGHELGNSHQYLAIAAYFESPSRSSGWPSCTTSNLKKSATCVEVSQVRARRRRQGGPPRGCRGQERV